MTEPSRRLRRGTLRGRIIRAYAIGLVLVVAAATVLAYLLVASRLRATVAEDLAVRRSDLRGVPAGDIPSDPYAQLLRAGRVVAHSPAAPDGPVLDNGELASVAGGQPVVSQVPGLRGHALLVGERRPDGDVVVVGASLAASQHATDQALGILLGAGR